MQEALGESLAWRAIATATRGKRTEITNEKVKNGWTIERKKGMPEGGEGVCKGGMKWQRSLFRGCASLWPKCCFRWQIQSTLFICCWSLLKNQSRFIHDKKKAITKQRNQPPASDNKAPIRSTRLFFTKESPSKFMDFNRAKINSSDNSPHPTNSPS